MSLQVHFQELEVSRTKKDLQCWNIKKNDYSVFNDTTQTEAYNCRHVSDKTRLLLNLPIFFNMRSKFVLALLVIHNNLRVMVYGNL